jgi:uncharacterized protein (TIGR00255 family)
MTGFGESHCQRDGIAVAVEVRSINNRYFKLTVRASEGYGALEPLIDVEVRRTVHRGTVQVNVRVDRPPSPENFKINVEVLERYRTQLRAIEQQGNPEQTVPLEALLPLPGVVNDASGVAFDAAADWPLIGQALKAAMQGMVQMRTEEGKAMAADLLANCRGVAASLDQIEGRAPLVVADYRTRLHERLKRTLSEFDVSLDSSDLIKEVCMFADRGDISEEIVRLRSHLDQFQSTLQLPESSGRKLEFLTQEMFREANTIGSKGNDVEIATQVIDIKAAIERIREMIQNIE